MKQNSSISIFLCLLSLVEIIVSTRKSTASQIINVLNDSCVQLGRIVSIQGGVELKRKEWSNFHPTDVGAELCVGDLIRSAPGARAIVYCVDPTSNLWTVTDGKPLSVTSSCRLPDQPAYTPIEPITPSRDPLVRGIPYIISPSHTWLLSTKPILHWLAVPGATSYVVHVSGPGVNWTTEVKSTSVAYPGNPSLKPVKEGYLLTVDADNGEAPAMTTFGLLDGNKAAIIRADAYQIAKQNLDNDAKTLALAELYIGQGLIAAATKHLEAAVARGSQTATVYCLLGDLYARVKLFHSAEDNYLKALQLGKATNDIEEQAIAAARLGEVYNLLGSSEQADYWLKQARQEYQALREQP